MSAAVKEPKTAPFDLSSLTPLYIMQRDFLKKIKKDWDNAELDEAIAYLNDIHKKYGE